MTKRRSEVGKHNGEGYILKYCQIGEEFPHLIDDYGPDDRKCKSWGWHLYLMNEGGDPDRCYLGQFTTKAAAMQELDYAVRALSID